MKILGQKALINLLRSNTNKSETLFSNTIDLCYSSDHKKGTWSFFSLVDMFLHGKLPLYPEVVLCLALHKMSDSIEEVRKAAITLMINLCNEKFPGEYLFIENSGVNDCYFDSQIKIAREIAKNHPKISLSLIREGLHRFRSVDNISRSRLLNFISPFFKNIQLTTFSDQEILLCAFLEKLLIITLKYSEEFVQGVADMWMNIAHTHENVVYITNYLVCITTVKRAKSLLLTACKIVLLISRANPQPTVEKLVYELYSIDKVGEQISLDEHQQFVERNMETQSKIPQCWAKDFSFMFPFSLKDKPFSRSNVSLILLTELILDNYEIIREHLPIILLLSFLGQDSSNIWVVKYSKTILASILFKSCGNEVYKSAGYITDYLIHPKTNQITFEALWSKKDYICRDGTLDTSDHLLNTFLLNYFELLEKTEEGIINRFSMMSLKWAVFYSTFSHYICRSLQFHRILKQPLREDSLYCILFCLHRHLVTRDPSGSREIMYESLTALHSMSSTVQLNDIVRIPQLWWSIVCALQTDCELEYWLSLDLLAVLLQQFDFNHPDIKKIVNKKPPGKWVNAFHGIQPLILKGLASNLVEPNARALLNEFLSIECPELIDKSPFRYLDNILVLLPWLMMNVVTLNVDDQQKSISITADIVQICTKLNFNDVSSVFNQYARGEYNTSDAFLDDLSLPFFNAFVKHNELRVFTMLRCFIYYGSPSPFHPLSLSSLLPFLLLSIHSPLSSLLPFLLLSSFPFPLPSPFISLLAFSPFSHCSPLPSSFHITSCLYFPLIPGPSLLL